uniref:Immunoglobulin domain-containing protein n=1 Tax=Cyprinus carpio TaxID=7962 RepID=A0A8C1NST3_CYPCA
MNVISITDFRLCIQSEALICVKSVYSLGVFGESVSVMEGDSVTLNTDVTEIRQDDDILWKFGDEASLIAKIKKNNQIFSTYDGPDGIFRDRLKLDNQTGSLTITNITTQHAGLYEAKIRGAKLTSKTFSVTVYGVFGESVSVMEGDSVTLHTDVTEIHEDDDILWMFGSNKSLIAEISRDAGIFFTYNGPDERFRDRLKLDNQTGSLTITNITTKHAGVYDVKISGAKLTSKTFNISVYNSDSLTVFISDAVAVAESLLIVTGFGIFCICWKCRKTDQEGKCFILLLL